MKDEEPLSRAYNAALRLLSYRPRSEAELKARLLRRFSMPTIENVLASLKEQHLLDDVSFAHFWRHSRESSRPRSATLIRRELMTKGVSREIAEAAIEDMDDDESAYRAGLKAARHLEKADFVTFRRKVWSYLQRRGFGPSLIRRTVNRLWEEKGNTPLVIRSPDSGEGKGF